MVTQYFLSSLMNSGKISNWTSHLIRRRSTRYRYSTVAFGNISISRDLRRRYIPSPYSLLSDLFPVRRKLTTQWNTDVWRKTSHPEKFESPKRDFDEREYLCTSTLILLENASYIFIIHSRLESEDANSYVQRKTSRTGMSRRGLKRSMIRLFRGVGPYCEKSTGHSTCRLLPFCIYSGICSALFRFCSICRLFHNPRTFFAWIHKWFIFRIEGKL